MRKASRDGVGFLYDTAGQGGTPLLFIHGSCCDHTFFAPQFERFGKSRLAVTVDLRGHGGSDKPPGNYSFSTFTEDLVHLCRGMGLRRVVPVGHSMGGMIALDMAARYPDLVAAAVALDTTVVLPPSFDAALRETIERMRGPDYLATLRDLFERYYFAPSDDPVRKELILERMSRTPQHVMVATFEEAGRYDGPVAARACTAPLLYVAASRFRTDPTTVRDLAPHADTGQVVGSGHFFQLEVPDQVNAMLDRFLYLRLPPG